MAATVEDAVIGRLKATSAVAAAVGARVYPQFNTQEPDLPLIVVTKQGVDGRAKLNGNRGRQRYSVKVDVYANTEAEAGSVAAAVYGAICPDGAWRDPHVSGVAGALLDDTSEDFTEDGFRVDSQTFGVWFSPVSDADAIPSLVGGTSVIAPCLLPAASRALGRLYQDAAKTLLATADGHPVRVATCPYTGQDYTAPSDAARPVLRTDGAAGHWWLAFDGVDDAMAGPTGTNLTGDSTFCVRAAQTVNQNPSRLLNSPDANALFVFRRSGNASLFVGSLVFSAALITDASPHTGTCSKLFGGNWSVWIDGAAQTVSAVANDWGRVNIGNAGVNPEPFTGNVYGLVVSKSMMSDADRIALEAQLAGLSP
jgi:hypothetical protein